MTEAAEGVRLTSIAARLVEQARKGGADVAEASASSGWELTAKVRLGQPELVQEAGHRGVALRVMKDRRVAVTSSSDWTEAGLERCVSDALSLVELSERDEFAGPADPALLSKGPYPDLDLFDESLDQLGAEAALELAEREGSVVACPLVTIVDDPLIPRGPGSRAFDGEGLASRRNVIVQDGVLQTFLLDSYCGRKLDKASTASAGRSGGGVGPSTSNLLLQPGTQTPEEVIASTGRGLFVTEMMGFGFNAVTGDFSRGAAGYWIEDGKLAFPVSEITISSNLDTMLQNIDAVANDLVLKSSTACPTLRISQMTLAGS